MKKLLIVCICLTALLCGCAQEAPQQATTEPTQESTGQSTEEATPPAPTDPSEEETTQAEKTPAQEKKELAMSCIDKDVEDLYALIGQPESSDYAPSCLGSGDDGNLYYEGFTVYTYKEGDKEIVRVVE